MSDKDGKNETFNAWGIAFVMHCIQLVGLVVSFSLPYAWWPIAIIFGPTIALLGDGSTPSLTDEEADGPFMREHGWAALKTALIYWLGLPLAAIVVFSLSLYETPYFDRFFDAFAAHELHPLMIMASFALTIDEMTADFLFSDFVLIACTIVVFGCYLEQVWRPVKWAYKARKHRNER